MRVARLVQPGQPFEVGTADVPSPGPNDVLVKVAAASLVPNSLNIANGKLPPTFQLPPLPAIFGLDASGVVEAVGERVFGVQKGDRVYVNPQLTCGTCEKCRSKREDICTNSVLRGYFGMSEEGARHFEYYPYGALSEYLLSPAAKVAILPPAIDLLTAARLGYSGTSYHALKQSGLAPGKTVLVNGVTGTLGVAAVAIALGMGATKILGLGRNQERLEQVEKLSPQRVKTRSSEDEGSLADWVKEQTGGAGVDLVYDCLGFGGSAESTSALFQQAVKTGGSIVLAAGGAEGDITASYSHWQMSDSPIRGSNWFSDDEIDELIALVAAGVVDFSHLKPKRFSLDEVNEAFKYVGDRPASLK
ncbi:hypothetical protein JCM8547_007603 [Rhodosporidiobolus lusitaniae]